MTVTRGMLDEPAPGGGVLAGLGLAGSLPFSPVSLGRNRVKERQPDEMIRRRRLGLTALSSPARAGLRSGAGILLAGSHPSGSGWFTSWVSCRATSDAQRARTTTPTVMTASQIASGG